MVDKTYSINGWRADPSDLQYLKVLVDSGVLDEAERQFDALDRGDKTFLDTVTLGEFLTKARR